MSEFRACTGCLGGITKTHSNFRGKGEGCAHDLDSGDGGMHVYIYVKTHQIIRCHYVQSLWVSYTAVES